MDVRIGGTEVRPNVSCLTGLFADTTKFLKIKNDPTFTQLTTLQQYLLQTIHKCNEIDNFTYDGIRPQSTRPAHAYGLPKIHKSFDILPPFQPIIDMTGTACQPDAKYLARLLSPLAQNEFTLKDSFDAVSRIHNIPKSLLDQGYKYVSFHVKYLFTNIIPKLV